ncbi:hypothetical protein Aab01nite_06700 [Paractinoplanes abujensis]|uniref:Uncharacterized protein n=1 Tax=Paractinoplanes abujensis TaxID=882441 RepID=A0A7W7CQP4_9ACTN|nr:hypothetical protein [Actinoplanes abujensis]MBB4691503.1 hypothetical protein [Actinoplanes abujensis]GID17080.1 hypothetical protein Aab01nite_06700 [Actinoplanes abujensis]
MSLSRYALRTAGFGALYLLATVAGLATASSGAGVRVVWPAAVVAALWLVAQGRHGHRNLDVIALSVLAVLAPGHDGGLLSSFVHAVPQVVPAVLFAWLFDRWLPGYWLGHGDRFRRPGPTLTRLAAAAALAALSGAVLHKVVDTELGFSEAGYVLLRDGVAVLLGVLVVRLVRRRGGASPGGRSGDDPGRPDSRRPGLTLVK